MKCSNCQDSYEIGKHPYYTQGQINFCAECYESLLKEKLPIKVAMKRLKIKNKYANQN